MSACCALYRSPSTRNLPADPDRPREEMQRKIDAAGLRIRPNIDFEIVHHDRCSFFDEHFDLYWQEYHRLMERKEFRPTMRVGKSVVGQPSTAP